MSNLKWCKLSLVCLMYFLLYLWGFRAVFRLFLFPFGSSIILFRSLLKTGADLINRLYLKSHHGNSNLWWFWKLSVVFAKALNVALQPRHGRTTAGKELLKCPYLTVVELFPQNSRASETQNNLSSSTLVYDLHFCPNDAVPIILLLFKLCQSQRHIHILQGLKVLLLICSFFFKSFDC